MSAEGVGSVTGVELQIGSAGVKNLLLMGCQLSQCPQEVPSPAAPSYGGIRHPQNCGGPPATKCREVATQGIQRLPARR